MTENLGKLESVHGVSPIFKQRAFVVAVVSFVFFTAMIFGYSLRRNFVFILLAASFLVVELFTLLGWLGQKNNEFRLFENGFAYKKSVCLWSEIASVNVKKEKSLVSGEQISCVVRKNDDQEIVLTEVIEGFESILRKIENKARTKTVS